MEEEIKNLVGNVDKDINIKFDYQNINNNVILSRKDWRTSFSFALDDDEKIPGLLNECIGRLSDLESLIKEDNIEVWIDREQLIIANKDWQKDYYIELESLDFSTIYNKIKDFFDLKYIPVIACYREDYFEVLINHTDMVWGDGLSHISFSIEDEIRSQDRICYEISSVSKEFSTIIENNQLYRNLEVEDNFTTLKIYNINKVSNISIEMKEIEEKLLYYAKCILFDLSYKFSATITFEELPEDDEDEGEFEHITEELNDIKTPYFKKEYDSDLIDYYHRALKMSDSEFKYLAYYQVLECIFDEVYLHETVQDVKQIMNSSWFSTHKDKDITEIIEIVEKYNKAKNDREKLKLVLERYFKGEVHDQAFFLANRDIIEILKNELKKIKQDKDLKDLQNLATVLYDFRCECTHSNRSYPFRTTFNKTNEELKQYINLIKKVSEIIILNYNFIAK
ncbi:methylamine utilization protein MauJ [Peribacillus frigoritolerans]|uniref:methylamine utilization protein MauJ n=1 Tax=Peribacillus frigoritolerans TaxID=450367 RepID=UPI0007BF12DD|nr:methylamine utilization protein MauJ [Peribacillus frigoritolerans]